MILPPLSLGSHHLYMPILFSNRVCFVTLFSFFMRLESFCLLKYRSVWKSLSDATVDIQQRFFYRTSVETANNIIILPHTKPPISWHELGDVFFLLQGFWKRLFARIFKLSEFTSSFKNLFSFKKAVLDLSWTFTVKKLY